MNSNAPQFDKNCACCFGKRCLKIPEYDILLFCFILK